MNFTITLGPDSARYWHAGAGGKVARPFHLRWFLPSVCRQNPVRWWIAWFTGWACCAVGMFGWRIAAEDTWRTAAACTALLLALPGVLGPKVTIPVGVDIPATGLALCGVALIEFGCWPAGLLALAGAAAIRETSPLWAALWLWSPLPLLALAVPFVRSLWVKPGPDPLGPRFQAIADHPVRASLEHHAGRWRDAWLMVAPWGVCLAALVSPSWPLIIVLVVAYGQLLVATDTVRLVHHAAGPAMAVAAASNLPTSWLLLAVVVHVVWWRTPERI